MMHGEYCKNGYKNKNIILQHDTCNIIFLLPSDLRGFEDFSKYIIC